MFHMEQISSYLQVGAALLGFLIPFGALWLKITRSFVKAQLEIVHVQDTLRKVGKLANTLTQNTIELRVGIEQREKELLRLEGCIDSQRKDMAQLIASFHRVSSSLDAMWLTLQRLHPDDVPKRASDRYTPNG